ncbi:hypothetical protein Tco_0685410 [Tanacetum coccineum]
MKDVFVSVENDLDETLKQNELLKDQLLEASLAEDVKNLVITSCVEIRNKDLHDEIERISKESKDVSNESQTTDKVCNDAFEVTQELSKRIVELEKRLSKLRQKSIAFENRTFNTLSLENIYVKTLQKKVALRSLRDALSAIFGLSETLGDHKHEGYTREVSSPFEDLSDIGSPRANDHELLELPYIPEDPYFEAALQAPHSPDMYPGPEEPVACTLTCYVPGDDGDDEMDIEEDEDDDMDIEAEDEDDEMDVERRRST